ncbi:MAG: histidinol dehydrogenase, partial [Thermoanaerobaculia bacterium]|nr:histidinol dehydrogenase [Thermoanaerobaculia bacterium]
MSGLRLVGAESPAGRRLRRRIAERLATVLDPRLEKAVRRIVARIRKGGDAALVEAARSYDEFAAVGISDLRLAPLAEDRGWPNIAPELREAVELAIDNVERFHRAQLAAGGEGFIVEEPGLTLAETVQPLARAGLYVPGGRASYPSTALMTVVPARVAGVASPAVATPAR